jgi:hypothetical protein
MDNLSDLNLSELSTSEKRETEGGLTFLFVLAFLLGVGYGIADR